ncbi:hypothetical protein F5I97DRAFT_945578 [Phlebopus sp. FC_14]|nr:hypothetical protein F5I97DRAFT_945578 [Phlebopus sp. FC_14]
MSMGPAGIRLTSSRSTVLAAPKSIKCARHQWVRRHYHTRKQLPYATEDGLGDFMSPRTLKMVAEEYQQGLLHRLNDYCRDVDDKRKTVAQIVLDSAMSQDRAMMFKYASHALNNSFFLHSLRPPKVGGEDVLDKSALGPAIRRQFGSFDSLRSQFSAAVTGMSGTGYVWFVTDAKQRLAFVPTFAAGTLLIRSRSGTVDPILSPVLGEILGTAPDTKAETATATGTAAEIKPKAEENGQTEGTPRSGHKNPAESPSSALGSNPTSPVSGISHDPPLHPSLPSRTLHTSAVRADEFWGSNQLARSVYDPAPSSFPSMPSPNDLHDFKSLGEYIYPLFCISVHEHCWLLDHGIWGKNQYLKEFWKVLDWERVAKKFDEFSAR